MCFAMIADVSVGQMVQWSGTCSTHLGLCSACSQFGLRYIEPRLHVEVRLPCMNLKQTRGANDIAFA